MNEKIVDAIRDALMAMTETEAAAMDLQETIDRARRELRQLIAREREGG